MDFFAKAARAAHRAGLKAGKAYDGPALPRTGAYGSLGLSPEIWDKARAFGINANEWSLGFGQGYRTARGA